MKLLYAFLEGQVNVRVIWKLLSATFTKWTEDHAQRLGAALAFYTVFSLAPILLIVIAMAGLVFGQEAAEGHIIGQIQDLVGDDSAKAIQGMLAYARRPSTSLIATGVALVTLLFGATSVFAQVQDALNVIWGVETKSGRGIIQIIKDRFISFVAVLGSGFLLLVSLVLSAALAAVGHTVESVLPAPELILQAINFLLSFVVITLLFAMIYKLIPDVLNNWQDVWVGAGMTSLLFTIGKSLIGLYLGKSEVGLAYGAAGSLIVVLLWVYYASQIFLFGAEFTAVYAAFRGSQLKPTPNALPIHDGASAVPDTSQSPRKVA
jgi:membrane protein